MIKNWNTLYIRDLQESPRYRLLKWVFISLTILYLLYCMWFFFHEKRHILTTLAHPMLKLIHMQVVIMKCWGKCNSGLYNNINNKVNENYETHLQYAEKRVACMVEEKNTT